jgi:methionine synthase I (cobalamin-dependent)
VPDEPLVVELAQSYATIRNRFPWINILGRCCGTDHRHIEQISVACVDLRPQNLKQ